ncbi:MAG: hypothetical protein HYT80_04690 [Euryarchaeota archaeon]|nr:hypothetical protein [Euryarchaeota archaeon]
MARYLLILAIVTGLTFPGCLSESADGPKAAGDVRDAAGNVTLPKTEIEDFTVTSWATPVRAFNQGGPAKLIKPDANTTGFIVEVAWTPVNQASTKMSVWIRKEGDGAVSPNNPTFLVNSPPPLKQKDGTSPIKIPLPKDAFKEPVNYQVYLRSSADPVGATVNQPAKMYLTQFQDLSFNETYSAVPK